MMPVVLEPAAPQSWVKHSTTEPLHSLLVISESCYKGTILHRKMTVLWSFSYNSFVKFHGYKMWELQQDCVISKSFCVITR